MRDKKIQRDTGDKEIQRNTKGDKERQREPKRDKGDKERQIQTKRDKERHRETKRDNHIWQPSHEILPLVRRLAYLGVRHARGLYYIIKNINIIVENNETINIKIKKYKRCRAKYTF